ncbi:LamG-like jellyroll fold domain-containing protein [Streptomyces sp. NPDC008343]|uniref:LamG-like jellyroll fold domain-containing protein n=1 Tax=Streptomyces sp. NPDC008343 TaxID=3364828 RepID=UPI0036EF8900
MRAALAMPDAADPQAREPAARELADRHEAAAFGYAVRCTTTKAAAELLRISAQRQAAQSFLRDGGAAWRPHLLNTILRTAAAWSDGEARRHLVPGLVSWLDRSAAAIPAPVPGDDAGGVPLLVQAFHQLPDRLQTLLWHVFVEGEDLTRVAHCTGSGTATVRRWSESAEDKFRAVYGRLYEESVNPQCRPYSRLVLTTARTGLSRTVLGGADELVGHVTGCASCARAFSDLSQLHAGQWAPLLAEQLLPWGGRQYAEDRAGQQRLPERRAAAGPRVPAGQRIVLQARRWAALAVAVVPAVTGAVLIGADESGPGPVTHAASPGNHADKWNQWATPSQQGPTPPPASPSPPPKPKPSASGKPRAGEPGPSRKPSPPAPRLNLAQARLRWDFESWGSHPKDSSSFGRPGEYHGYVDWREDRDGAVWFDGKSHVQTSQAVLDTSRSFTVSAWARPEPGGGPCTVAAQDGANESGFLLQHAGNRWRLAMGRADSPDAARDGAQSAGPPAMNKWQHLTGVFDAGKQQLRLYVDGRLQSTRAHPSAWQAGGSFTVGRGQRNGDGADLFRGYLDDVRAFQRALSTSEIADLVAAPHNR